MATERFQCILGATGYCGQKATVCGAVNPAGPASGFGLFFA
ncbi:hypothetical protein F0726_00766 [Acidithiobacillus caldus]|nr:hypothetical protein F0726_00766 [Acidithiobacillus caldus]